MHKIYIYIYIFLKKKMNTFSSVRAWWRSNLNPSLITDLYLITRSWLFFKIALASCRAFFNNSLSSTTKLTNPNFSACSAVKGMAVNDTSRALFGPIMRGSFWDEPHEGNIPNLQTIIFRHTQNQYINTFKLTFKLWLFIVGMSKSLPCLSK